MRRASLGETKRTPDAVEEAVTTAALCAAGRPCCEAAASCAAALPVRTIAEKMIEKIRRAVCMMFTLFWLCAGNPLLNSSQARTPSEPEKPFNNLTRKERPNGITPRKTADTKARLKDIS